ncbi:MAG: site-specific integrase [Pirellulaceae bacterium]
MATGKSTKSARPGKPYPDFPLTPHPSGKWCKRIRGRLYYFGSWDDWTSALEEYQRVRDYLQAGKTPPPDEGEITVQVLCNQFLEIKDNLVRSGDITTRTFSEYQGTCTMLVDVLGKRMMATHVGPSDFIRIRTRLAKRLGPTRLANEINRVRSVFKFGYEHQFLEKPAVFGQGFKRPSQRTLRVHRQKVGERLYTPKQIQTLMEAATMPMRAMILLGLNAGLGNSDCGQLEFDNVDFQTGWLSYPRPKTGIDRKAKLWPETIAAIKAALTKRGKPKLEEFRNRIFVTKRGLSWFKNSPDNPISKEFRKLADDTKVYRRGLTFYTLRHTFATIAGDTGDQVAVNHVMGHVDDTMAAVYRERISDARLERVADHVHAWLFGKETTP